MRHRSVEQTQGYARVAGMKETPLPFHDDHLVMLVGQDEFFGRAGDEIGDDAIDGAAAAGHENAGLARGHEGGIDARLLQAPGDFHGGDHFAAAAIVGDRVNAEALGANAAAMGNIVFVVAAKIDQRRAVASRRLGEFGIVGQELVQAGNHGHAAAEGLQHDRPPVGGNLASRRRDAQQQRVGRRGIGQRGHDGNRPSHAQQLAAGLPCPAAIEHGHNFLGPVADDADRRLGRTRIGVSVDQDHHSARLQSWRFVCLL